MEEKKNPQALPNDYAKQFERLSEVQRACVLHGTGPAIVLAGPGSGKTRVITVRTVRLITEGGSGAPLGKEKYGSVLTLAFNKAAAEEMKTRCEQLLAGIPEEKRGRADFATVHSYCFKIIRDHARETGSNMPKVLEGAGKENCLLDLFRSCTGEKQIREDTVKRLFLYIGRAANGLSVKEVQQGCSEAERTAFETVRESYIRYKKENGFLDFDDMIAAARLILQENPDFCRQVAARYDFVQVDEAQDLSKLQFDIIQLLGHGNVFAVADDDQSIYGFRGAEPSLLFGFEKQNGCRKYLLEENYRSRNEITSVASRFIRANTVRFEKNIFTRNGGGGRITVRPADSFEKQALFIRNEIRKLAKEQAGSVCILYRNNISFLCPAICLAGDAVRAGLAFPPICVKGDLSAYAVLSVFSGIVKEALRRERLRTGIFLPPAAAFLREMKEDGSLDRLLFCDAVAGKRKFFVNCIRAATDLLFQVSGGCAEADAILQFLYRLNGEKTEAKDPDHTIFFSTAHSSKGLEFDSVFIIDALEGEFPGSDVLSQESIEEERRLFYVAMTRAKKRVYITYPRNALKKDAQDGGASRFVLETKKLLCA